MGVEGKKIALALIATVGILSIMGCSPTFYGEREPYTVLTTPPQIDSKPQANDHYQAHPVCGVQAPEANVTTFVADDPASPVMSFPTPHSR